MAASDADKLREILAFIDANTTPGDDGTKLAERLSVEFDAIFEKGDPNRLRCAGLTATCTWSLSGGLISNWITAARNRLDRMDAAAEARRLSIDIGHNSNAAVTDNRLRLLIERIERLEEEKKGLADDVRDVLNEAKAVGYDTKMMRQIIRLRAMDPDKRREMELVLDTYKNALGLD